MIMLYPQDGTDLLNACPNPIISLRKNVYIILLVRVEKKKKMLKKFDPVTFGFFSSRFVLFILFMRFESRVILTV